MLLTVAALSLLAWGIVIRKLRLPAGIKRRLAIIAAVTVILALGLIAMRLVPIGIIVLLLGAGLGANTVMRARGPEGGFEEMAEGPPSGRARATGMARREALAVLGLEEGADDDAINAAHKRMIVRAHPDQGGSDYLAAKVNEARLVLLRKS